MLQINLTQGIYEIKGQLNSQNSKSLKSHFETVLNFKSELIINLDKLQKIDKNGINSIFELYKIAMNKNKIIYIIGKTNTKIKEVIAQSKLKYIVKSDFI